MTMKLDSGTIYLDGKPFGDAKDIEIVYSNPKVQEMSSPIGSMEASFHLPNHGHFEKGVWVKPIFEILSDMSRRLFEDVPIMVTYPQKHQVFSHGIMVREYTVPYWIWTGTIGEMKTMSSDIGFERRSNEAMEIISEIEGDGQ